MKKIITTVLVIFSFSIVSNAQVFIIDDDINNPRVPNNEFHLENPGYHGSGEDWYTPLSDGALLLTVLGGAYLLGKNKSNK